MKPSRSYILVLLLFALGLAFAQDPRGSMTGIVTDPQGGRVPNASVTVTSVETNVVHRLITNDAGAFELQLLNPGNYSVTVEVAGFKKALYKSVELSVAGRVELNCQLEIGQTAESVDVTDTAPLLNDSGIALFMR